MGRVTRMRLEINSTGPEMTREVGRHLGELAREGDVILLVGDLGSGKTCLTQGIAWGLGIADYALSPTFVIMRELHGRLPLYHVDLYRIDRLAETEDLGLDDYLYGHGVTVLTSGHLNGLEPVDRMSDSRALREFGYADHDRHLYRDSRPRALPEWQYCR